MNGIKTAGIVAEFNPFHNGHELLIKKIRQMGFSHIAVVMSGNYTQRGEPAVMLKSARARAAVLCGVDLVLELPVPFSVSSAEKFAFGAVSILNSLNIADALCFGSECGDIGQLEICAEKLYETDGSPKLADELKNGVSFPKARANALNEYSEILSNPNDTLAIEYLKALKKLGSPMMPTAIRRAGARHDGDPAPHENIMIPSASALRQIVNSGTPWSVKKYMPKRSFLTLAEEMINLRAPFQYTFAEPLILSKLRVLNKENLKTIPDVTEGLENRIFRAAHDACSLEELYSGIKTKRYTLARIRRIILRAFLGIDSSYTASPPPYLRVLAFNGRGQELLRLVKKASVLPIITRYADVSRLDDSAKRLYDLECRASDLYTLCLPKTLPCGYEQKFTAIKISS